MDDLEPAWGLGRVRPFPSGPVVSYASVELDPVTQTGVYRDAEGSIVQMGKHGTNKTTSSATATSGGDGGDGKPPKGDADSVTDYASD